MPKDRPSHLAMRLCKQATSLRRMDLETYVHHIFSQDSYRDWHDQWEEGYASKEACAVDLWADEIFFKGRWAEQKLDSSLHHESLFLIEFEDHFRTIPAFPIRSTCRFSTCLRARYADLGNLESEQTHSVRS